MAGKTSLWRPVVMPTAKRIPIKAGREIAERYGYDQVIIIARKVGVGLGSGEHVTTYGVDTVNCAVAARIGDFFKYKLMGWSRDNA